LLLHGPNAADIIGGSHGNAIESLLHAGKIKHFGISCDDPVAAAAALDIGMLSFLEIPINALDNRFESTTTLALQRGVGVLARSPFDGGRLIRVAARREGGCSEVVLAALLRTVMDRPDIVSTILGANTRVQMRINLAASRHPVAEDTRRQIIEEIRQLDTNANSAGNSGT
jgi:aryl-alcohol dehydrogenase-like predicted oxidoreductase